MIRSPKTSARSLADWAASARRPDMRTRAASSMSLASSRAAARWAMPSSAARSPVDILILPAADRRRPADERDPASADGDELEVLHVVRGGSPARGFDDVRQLVLAHAPRGIEGGARGVAMFDDAQQALDVMGIHESSPVHRTCPCGAACE